MQHISSHMAGGPERKRDKATERGELMRYFMGKLNMTRARDGLPPLTMPRIGRVLQVIPTNDLYFLKSVCDDVLKRNGIDAFSKRFWWEVKPKPAEGESEAKPTTVAKPKREPGAKKPRASRKKKADDTLTDDYYA
jgi:hypothetical protein